MTDKDFYKETFSVLKSSGEFILEEKQMKKAKINRVITKLATAVAAFALVLTAGNVITYAATGETLFHKVSVWINGSENELELKPIQTKDGSEAYSGTIQVDDNTYMTIIKSGDDDNSETTVEVSADPIDSDKEGELLQHAITVEVNAATEFIFTDTDDEKIIFGHPDETENWSDEADE